MGLPQKFDVALICILVFLAGMLLGHKLIRTPAQHIDNTEFLHKMDSLTAITDSLKGVIDSRQSEIMRYTGIITYLNNRNVENNKRIDAFTKGEVRAWMDSVKNTLK